MGREYILIVDDQPESIELISVLLSSHMPDLPTQSAPDGETALNIIANEAPSLVILDVKMPGIDGFEVCRRIKETPATAELPVLLVSGVLTRSKHRAHGLNVGADGYICKPFEPHELIAQVQSLLRLKRNSDALRARGRDLEDELERRAGDLLRSEEKYRTLVEQLPAIAYIMDLGPPKRVSFVSSPMEKLLGFTPEEWMDNPVLWQNQIHPEDRPAVLAEMEAHDQTGEPYSMDYRILSHEGALVWFRNEGVYLRDADGKPTAIHGVMHDITARKHAEDALQKSEEKLQHVQKMEALGRLSGGVAHDFNNLLTTILGYGRMIEEQIEDPALQADLQEIIHAGERAEDLTRRLLTFGHKGMVQLMPMDINGVIADMDRLLRRTLGNDIELVTLLGENLGYVNADEGQVSQIIINLAVNARNAMPQGGKLTLQSSRIEVEPPFCVGRPELEPGAYVLLEVRDTGCGIRADVQERIFEPFFTTRRKGEGTGLGLSIVYGIVRQCAGHIELESQVQQGTCFRIFLPIVDGESSPTQEIEKNALPRGMETILLVEDEPAVRRLATRILTDLGYRVLEARHGGDALRRFEQESGAVDLVLSDVVMPHLGGPELVHELMQRAAGLKALFVTGYSQHRFILQNERSYPILLKPYTRESLAWAVREALDSSLMTDPDRPER